MKRFLPLEIFRCEPLLGARLSRRACGARHAKAKAKGEKGVPGLVTGTCARCGVGAQHAKRVAAVQWADGTSVEVRSVVPVLGQQRLGEPAGKPLRQRSRRAG